MPCPIFLLTTGLALLASEEPSPPPAASALVAALLEDEPARLAAEAVKHGDAARGAVLFHQPFLTCTRCHSTGEEGPSLGPDLTKKTEETTPAHLVESVLRPSLKIRKGFEAVTLLLISGELITALLVSESDVAVVLREATGDGKERSIAKEDITQRVPATASTMPDGLLHQLTSRQQFLDLARYLIEIAAGGPLRALELKPDPSLYRIRIAEYEKDIDHTGMIRALDAQAFARGEAIYARVCQSCHGTHDQPGSLPTSLRFASGAFKNGADPYSIYQTLTRGFGMMAAQTWMVPQQKYDVIHYLRDAYLRQRNPTQHVPVTDAYLAGLPRGTSRGPPPSTIEPWVTMDYGNYLIGTYEVGRDGTNFAYKGIAVRLDGGPGGVSRGRHWLVFDHDTMRVAAAWSRESAKSEAGFIDWHGIHFDGAHGIHPRLVGRVAFACPTGPGWAHPETGTWDDPRLRGRDGRAYGPLPRDWARYRGLYRHGDELVVAYTVGTTEVLEMPGVIEDGELVSFTRSFEIGRRDRPLCLLAALHPVARALLREVDTPFGRGAIVGPAAGGEEAPAAAPLVLDGTCHVELDAAAGFNLTTHDFCIVARLKTCEGGTLFCETSPGEAWVPDGKSLFVRDGRLCFDIGWVGVVTSTRRVDDGELHTVSVSWKAATGSTRLSIDGRTDGEGVLKPRGPAPDAVIRLGYTAADFPQETSHFRGELLELRFHQAFDPQTRGSLVASWSLAGASGQRLLDSSGNGHHGRVIGGGARQRTEGFLAALVTPSLDGLSWSLDGAGRLVLDIPAGEEPLRFKVSLRATASAPSAEELAAQAGDAGAPDLRARLRGGPPRWPQAIETPAAMGRDDAPFAVDVLTHPDPNPWLARVRLTGIDFFPGGDRAVLTAWDGDVWTVEGLGQPSIGKLRWRRIAAGFFQPLGVRVIDSKVHVTCRDQLVVLHDLNGDLETDFHECLNNDHQVTEHFHEFAMGLQTDTQGNFYYAKSARHALPALVPHHGTLLRIAKDGSRTDILARGFRAANGVCLNPDGTFFVSDQEGHWNPKNRINWVRPGDRFYGNMFGYHDVMDSSDAAMEPPLCWITNAFDRSPAELLWVPADAWGSLGGTLLNLSYGHGKVFVVPHERIGDRMQGGLCALPLPPLSTGVMRGRFHPVDRQLYACGMFAWAGSATEPGGFYRLRHTGKPTHLPMALRARRSGLEIAFSGQIDAKAAGDAARYAVKVWSLRRTANYGSAHHEEHPVRVARAELLADGKTVRLEVPDLAPTWCMEIAYTLASEAGEPVNGIIHNTIHALGD